MAAEATGLTELVDAAIHVSDTGSLDAYLRWNFVNLINELYPEDFTAEELMACNVVFAQAMSRKLSSLAGPRQPLLEPFLGRVGAPPLGAKVGLRLVPSAGSSSGN